MNFSRKYFVVIEKSKDICALGGTAESWFAYKNLLNCLARGLRIDNVNIQRKCIELSSSQAVHTLRSVFQHRTLQIGRFHAFIGHEDPWGK